MIKKKNNNDWFLEDEDEELFLEPEDNEDIEYESAMEP